MKRHIPNVQLHTPNGYEMAPWQKKLEELETELNAVFCIPLETTPGPRHDISFDDIEQQFEFLRLFLKAELASQPENADHLHKAEERLASLKSAFREWNESRMSVLNNDNVEGTVSLEFVHQPKDAEGTEERLAAIEAAFRESRISARKNYDLDEASSICSDCFSQTLRCDMDDVEDSESAVSVPASFSSSVVRSGGDDKEGNIVKKEEMKGGKMCKRWGVFGSGMVVGALVCMIMMVFSSLDLSAEYNEVFLFPPPT